MDKKVSKKIAINEEVILPLENEVLNPRNPGGNAYDINNVSRGGVVPSLNERNSTGKKSKYPYEIKREGVEHR